LIAAEVCRSEGPCLDDAKCDSAVHLLHPIKSAGAAVRAGVSCFCSSDEVEQFGSPFRGEGGCAEPTTNLPFVCHGHATTVAKLPEGARYSLIVRHPESAVLSFLNYCRGWRLELDDETAWASCVSIVERFAASPQPHRRPQPRPPRDDGRMPTLCASHFLDAPERPPAFLGTTERLARSDWARFRATFADACADAWCADVLEDRHNASRFAFVHNARCI
jgi:hypothetical protein